MKADGSLRDALSIFDQIVTFAGNKISYSDVIENLNILDYDYYFKLTKQLKKKIFQQHLLFLMKFTKKVLMVIILSLDLRNITETY